MTKTKTPRVRLKKKIPTFKSEKGAEVFVDTADLTEYDLSGGQLVRFAFERKTARVKGPNR